MGVQLFSEPSRALSLLGVHFGRSSEHGQRQPWATLQQVHFQVRVNSQDSVAQFLYIRSLPIDENGEVCGQKIYRWKSFVRSTMIIIPPQSPGFVIYCCLGSVWWTILSCSMIWSCIDFSQTIKLKLSGLLVLTTILSNLWGHVCITSIVLFFCPLLFTMRCSVHRESLLHISE